MQQKRVSFFILQRLKVADSMVPMDFCFFIGSKTKVELGPYGFSFFIGTC